MTTLAPLKSVSFKHLSALYLCLPVCLLIVLADQLLFNQQLKKVLPHSPQSLFLFALFFGLPHIIASNTILFSNSDYLQYFKQQLLFISSIIIGFILLCQFVFSYTWAYFLFAAITILHVLKQQFGLTRAVARLGGKTYQLWMWSGILAGIAIYTCVFMFKLLSKEQLYLLTLTACCICVFFILQGTLLYYQAQPGMGRIYLVSNTLLIPISLALYMLGYSFLTILCPRIIHDCSAFLIYLNHDQNRRNSVMKNRLYHYADRLKLPTFIVVIGVAVMIAYLLRWQGQYLSTISLELMSTESALGVALLLKTFLELLHYYMESVTWKANSPYRKYVQFRKH